MTSRRAVAPQDGLSAAASNNRHTTSSKASHEEHDDKAKGFPSFRPAAHSYASETRWILRSLCCLGVLIILQSLLILRWTTAGCDPPSLAEAAGVLAHHPHPTLPPAGQNAAGSTTKRKKVKLKKKKRPKTKTVLGRQSSRATTRPSGGQEHAARSKPSSVHMPLGPLSSLSDVERGKMRLHGKPPPSSVMYTVGFGSVGRKKDYVLETVGTMLGFNLKDGRLTKATGKGNNYHDGDDGDEKENDGTKSPVLTDKERDMVVIVVHLADWNKTWVNSVSNILSTDYKMLVDDGQFHILHAPEEWYPPIEICPPACTYNDEPTRVKWRSKQNLDYAFLMHYSIPLAPYYLQIEDDLGFANGWVGKIDDFREKSYPPTFRNKDGAPWRLIDFSQLGFIGKLFQADELFSMAQFLLLFYDQMPCDLLLGNWMESVNQKKRIDYWRKHPSLFMHLGVFRTLGGFQPLQERKFGKLLFSNPAAQFGGTMTTIPSYEAKFIYFPGGDPARRNDQCDYTKSPAHHKVKQHRCWFWATEIKAGDYLEFVFSDLDGTAIKGLLLEQGHPHHPKDVFDQAEVAVAGQSCTEFFTILKLEPTTNLYYWEAGVSDPPELPFSKVKCVRVTALQAQDHDAVLQQLQIRVT